MGARQAYTENFDLIRTLEDRQSKLVAQELQKAYLFKRFRETAQVVKCYDNIEIPIYLGPGTNGKWMVRGSVLPDAADSQLAQGYYDNRYLAVPAGIDMIDQWENEGNNKALFKLVEFAQWEAMVAHYRAMAYAVFSGSGVNGQPYGLSTILEKAAPASQTAVIGGINKATKAWWTNQYVQLTQNFGTIVPGTTIPAGFWALLQLISQCTVGTMVPSDIVTTKAVFDNVKRGMLEIGNPQYMLQKRQHAEYGIDSFIFDGQDISWDTYCPADSVYCLHLRDNFEPNRTGEKDKTKLSDYEHIAKNSVLSLAGGLFMIINPNVRMRALEARTPYRQLSSHRWWVDSFNMGVLRMSDHGVAGSDNGSRWETW